MLCAQQAARRCAALCSSGRQTLADLNGGEGYASGIIRADVSNLPYAIPRQHPRVLRAASMALFF